MKYDTNRQNMFQHAVLAGLWVLILCAFGKRPHRLAVNFQIAAITFGDIYGVQTEEAKQYRRDITYGGIL